MKKDETVVLVSISFFEKDLPLHPPANAGQALNEGDNSIYQLANIDYQFISNS